MKVVFTNNIFQNAGMSHSEVQLIDGVLYNWIVEARLMKIDETFREWLVRLEKEMDKELHKDTIGIVVYDFIPIEGVPKIGDYTGKGAMMIRYDYLNPNK